VGVRSSKTGALMGMITSIPVHTRVYDKSMPMAEINYLCVHKKLRYRFSYTVVTFIRTHFR
jgi:glycylpeptide N-tetradecanoyltransferase